MYVVVPPLRVTLPIPDKTDPIDPTDLEEDAEEDQVTNPPMQNKTINVGYRNIVNNHNVINNATTHNVNNVNNVIVHITRNNANGALRTVVIRNNETTVLEEEPITKLPTSEAADCGAEDTTEQSTKASIVTLPCCTIVSPRVCRKQGDEWVCFHRKQYVCSQACTAKEMYLKPRKPSYQHPWLIMPPLKNAFARLHLCQSADCPRPGKI
uniref:Uncharacterized protein n=1 Tax=Anopheles culicifacies TaxID=139723 RepID=A0A182M458_9DIPT